MSRLLKAAESATTFVDLRRPQTLQPLPFLFLRFFAAESEPPPVGSSPIDLFLCGSTSGPVYAKLFGNARHTLKSDVVGLLNVCNWTVDEVMFQSRYDFDQAFKAIARKGRLYRIEKADKSQWDNVTSYDGKTVSFPICSQNGYCKLPISDPCDECFL